MYSSMVEKQFMNEPIVHNWTDDEIVQEFQRCQDKRKVAKMYCVPVREVTAILKKFNDIDK